MTDSISPSAQYTRDQTVTQARERSQKVIKKLSVEQRQHIDLVEQLVLKRFRCCPSRYFAIVAHGPNEGVRQSVVLLFRKHPKIRLGYMKIAEYLNTSVNAISAYEFDAIESMKTERSEVGALQRIIWRELGLDHEKLLGI